MKLKVGDLIYFDKHKATALLLEKHRKNEEDLWSYALRSPIKTEEGEPVWNKFMVGFMSSEEQKLINSIENGDFVIL